MPRSTIALLLSALLATPAGAIITLGGDGRLLAPPSGIYRDSGVQYTGTWGAFVGTAIGPHHFITAGHVGGGAGNVFLMGDKKHVAESRHMVEGTDLAVWRVRERFERWAPLSETRDEGGKEIILYGRGCKRGRPLLSGGVTRGWLWGEADDSLSWGRNRVEGAMPLPGSGTMLVFGFDRNGGDEEGTVGSGDSGGGVFLQEGTTWKLAGVIHASGGQYSRVRGRSPFMAALYDARGFYQNAGEEWEQIAADAVEPAPTLAFATRIAEYAPAIRAITGSPPPENKLLTVSAYALLTGAALIVGALALVLARRKTPRHTEKEPW